MLSPRTQIDVCRIMEATAAVQAGIFKNKSAKPQAASDSAIENVFSEIERRIKTEGAALVAEVKGRSARIFTILWH